MHLSPALIARWLRFLTVGGLCFGTNLLVLYIGTDMLGLHYLVSMGISILVANTLGWALNRRWTFRSGDTQRLREFGRYIRVNLSSYVLSLALMALMVSWWGVHYLLASALIAVCMTAVNFTWHTRWSFAREHQPTDRS